VNHPPLYTKRDRHAHKISLALGIEFAQITLAGARLQGGNDLGWTDFRIVPQEVLIRKQFHCERHGDPV
jgi:hypothetical protein